jgi:hypothetical protein
MNEYHVELTFFVLLEATSIEEAEELGWNYSATCPGLPPIHQPDDVLVEAVSLGDKDD